MLHGEPFTEAYTYNQSGQVQRAIEAFQEGKPALVHDADDREGETDMIYPARAVTPEDVVRLRKKAGGLICVAVSDAVAEEFQLPFMADALDHPVTEDHDLTYDSRSSFSLTVNHRSTDTGITDIDRAKTISSLGSASQNPSDLEFSTEFRSPGHVHILRAAPGLLDERQGHTELGIALAQEADCAPAVVVCEMLDDDSGHALSTREARRFAKQRNIPFLEGKDLIRTV
jgi:3,4-dihydroxy 2-butanone 4-phosphate synthase